MTCVECKGTGCGGLVNGNPTVCSVCNGRGKVSSTKSEEEVESLKAELGKIKKDRDLQITRRVDLECALLWWVNERMKGFSDSQYGKGKLKELIADGKCFDVKKDYDL